MSASKGSHSFTMLHHLPSETIEDIAWNLLPTTKDVRSLSTVHTSMVRPTRKALFRDCHLRVGNGRRPLEEFAALLANENSISNVIRVLSVEGDNKARTPILNLEEIITLIKSLPVLKKLGLYGLAWTPSSSTLPLYKHETL